MFLYSGYDNVDLNGRTHTGFAIAQTTSRNGSRLSTARAFIRPVKSRSNLHILLNATVTRIIFNNNRQAIGVEYSQNNQLKRVSVRKEVVVSGGNLFKLASKRNISFFLLLILIFFRGSQLAADFAELWNRSSGGFVISGRSNNSPSARCWKESSQPCRVCVGI